MTARPHDDARSGKLLASLRGRTARMVDDLAGLVQRESPSVDAAAIEACATHVEDWVRSTLGVEEAEWLRVDGRPHLKWQFGARPTVLVLAHLDTVWPAGTLERWPFARRDDGTVTGPGVFDMKAGLVQGIHALSLLDDLDGVTLMVTSDEEVGSPSSRDVIIDAARAVRAVLVLEPSVDGKLKVGRKGGSMYTLEALGKAAHAGLEPERGVNATVALAHAITHMELLGEASRGTTVTPTVVRAGTTTNTVPARAAVDIDVRALSLAEQERVDAQLRRLRPVVPGTRFTVHGGINRPPLTTESSTSLFDLARRAAARLGLSRVDGATVGGASDGNFTSAAGIPTLDGLGAVGAGAHAEGEHVVVSSMPERAALVHELVRELQTG